MLDLILPELSIPTQAAFRTAYGVLLLITLAFAYRQGRRFFLSERWGGYGQSGPSVDALQNPVAYPVVAALWWASAALLTLGMWSTWAALVNLLLCRYFFIQMRWRGLLRGMGAPGFMTYWCGLAVFVLEFTLHHAPAARGLALLVLQVDFALIMLSAGVYKFTAGYPRNQGMELGMVNPEWGYWWKFYARRSPGSWVFKVCNQLAWSTEVVAGVLMLVPATRFWGALLILLSFVFIATQIRLGTLTEMVMAACVLFFAPTTPGGALLDAAVPTWLYATDPAFAAGPAATLALQAVLVGYQVCLPLAYGGLYFNFYARKRLPRPLQPLLEVYTNFFGIIIWRVFSVDVVNFFIRIYRQPQAGGKRELVTDYDRFGSRYNHVGECITVTSIFTTLKYYPSNGGLFTERLLRYARTVPCPADSVLVFSYVSVRKTPGRFDFVPVAEYLVDPAKGTLTERRLSEEVSVRAAHAVSPVFEGATPGSYAPLR